MKTSLARLSERLGLRRSVALLCLLAGTLLVVVALAARAYQPVSGDEPQREPSAQFFDYLFTAAAIIWILGAVLLVSLVAGHAKEAHRFRLRIGLPGILYLVAIVVLLIYGRELFDRLREDDGNASGAGTATTQTATSTQEATDRDRDRSPEFEWPLALAVALGGVAAAGVLLTRRGRRAPDAESLAQALADALDDTLDDLRSEADPRRAVIAAYARMERLLAAHGVARKPAEAPLEYLERVLLELDAGERPVAALTRLFEEAKFSDHELTPARRDDAIAALVEIRDRLREAR